MCRDARHTALALVALVAMTAFGCATTVPTSAPDSQTLPDEAPPEAPAETFERVDPPIVDPNVAGQPATTLPTPRLHLDDTLKRPGPPRRLEPHVHIELPQPPPRPSEPPPVAAPIVHPPQPDATTASASADPDTPATRDEPRTSRPTEPPRDEPRTSRATEPPRDEPRASRPTEPTAEVRPPTPDRPLADAESGEARDQVQSAEYADFVWPTTEDPRVVRPGSEITVVLPGTGWLYVGKEYGDGSVTLLGKSGSERDESFRFRVSEPGDYRLWFQQQDPLAGTFTNERFALRAVPASETQRPATTGGVDAGDALHRDPGPVERPSPIEQAGRLLDAGEEIEALVRVARAFTEAGEADPSASVVVDEDLARRFADVAARAPAPTEVLRDFWRGLASSGVLETEAHRSLLEIGIRDGEIDDVLEAFLWLEHSDAGNGAGAAAAMPDETLFELARRLERPGPGRDLQRALSLYRAIVDDRPLSRYWDDSRSRIEYLQRHYFDVR